MKESTRIALMLLNIAAAAGMGDKDTVAAKQKMLRDTLAGLENLKEIEGGWNFGGSRHFIAGRAEFAAYPWLDAALQKVEESDWAGLAAVLAGPP